MTTITASEAVLATISALEPETEDLDVKYGLFNTVVTNAGLAGLWTTRMSVAVRNASEFKAWAMALGYTVLVDASNESLATNIDGLGGETLARFLISWRKIDTFALRDRVSIHEGDQLAFDIVTLGYEAGDEIYWTNTGTTNAQDFGIGPAMARPQGSFLTRKSVFDWALENSAMKRLIRLYGPITDQQGNSLGGAGGNLDNLSDVEPQAALRSTRRAPLFVPILNNDLAERFRQQIVGLKQKLEYEAGLKQQVYNDAVSQYEGELTLSTTAPSTDVKTTINLLVFRDKGLEQATGITETDETLVIKLWADAACTQLLYTSATYTVVNEV